MFNWVPREELAVTAPESAERSFELSKGRERSTCALERVSEAWERALSVPEGLVVSTCLFSSGLLLTTESAVPPGWNVLAAGMAWLETG